MSSKGRLGWAERGWLRVAARAEQRSKGRQARALTEREERISALLTSRIPGGERRTETKKEESESESESIGGQGCRQPRQGCRKGSLANDQNRAQPAYRGQLRLGLRNPRIYNVKTSSSPSLQSLHLC